MCSREEEDVGPRLREIAFRRAAEDRHSPHRRSQGNDHRQRAQGQLLDPPGLSADKLSASQKEALHTLLKSYAFRHRAEVAEADLKKIEQAGFEKVHFRLGWRHGTG